MVKLGECIYYGEPPHVRCPNCGQVFLDTCGGGHIALRERFCSTECAKNFKIELRKGETTIAVLDGTADHKDIEDAVAQSMFCRGTVFETK